MSKMTMIKISEIQNQIYTIRNKQVMIDQDLADLYGVDTKVLDQAVKRNKVRFPTEFMFQLTKLEFENWISQIVTSNEQQNLKSQIVTSSPKHGGRNVDG